MTMVHLVMWTNSGGLLMNRSDFNLVVNMTKLRIFLRQNVMTMSNVIDVLANCLNDQFPGSHISTDKGLMWSIKVDIESSSDKTHYDRQVHYALVEFFDNDIVRNQIRETISESDKITFYNILYKFSSGELSPANMVTTSILPMYESNYATLFIEF